MGPREPSPISWENYVRITFLMHKVTKQHYRRLRKQNRNHNFFTSSDRLHFRVPCLSLPDSPPPPTSSLLSFEYARHDTFFRFILCFWAFSQSV